MRERDSLIGWYSWGRRQDETRMKEGNSVGLWMQASPSFIVLVLALTASSRRNLGVIWAWLRSLASVEWEDSARALPDVLESSQSSH
jgi:hypothetical protein